MPYVICERGNPGMFVTRIGGEHVMTNDGNAALHFGTEQAARDAAVEARSMTRGIPALDCMWVDLRPVDAT